MKYIFSVAILFLIAGCVPTVQPTSAQIEDASKAETMCMIKAIKKLDDKVSSADLIAKAAAPLCAKEIENYVETAHADKSFNVRKMLKQAMLKGETSLALVLKLRNVK